MERLRTLSEEECYERCYGWRCDEDTREAAAAGTRPVASSPRTWARGCGYCSSFASTHASPKPPDRLRRSRRPRARRTRRLLRDQPRARECRRARALREPAERLLAPATRRRLHASSPRAARVPGAPGVRHRPHECRPQNHTRVERPSCGRLRGCTRAARDDRSRARSARHRVRRQGRLSGCVSRAPRARPAGAQARRRRRCSSCRRPPQRTPPSRGTSGFAGFGTCASSSS